MSRQSKRTREIAKLVDVTKTYTAAQAIEMLKKCPPVKFDQSVDISLKLGVDPRNSAQQVRGTVSLPNGTGKSLVVIVFARGDMVQEALAVGADHVGNDELLVKVQNGWTNFDAVIATPDMMREVGKLGKVLGPRGLMPSPKAGTVTNDIAKAVKEIKAGRIEFKLDRSGVISAALGKISFGLDELLQNVNAFIQAIAAARPSSAKGQFMKSVYLSSTMGPGLKIDIRESDVKE